MLQVILVRPGQRDMMGATVALLEHDPICHIATDMGDGWTTGEECVGFWGRPSEQFVGCDRIQLPLTEDQEKKVVAQLRGLVGTSYDYTQIAIDALNVEHLGLVGKVWQHLHDKGKHPHYVCSGVIAAACAVAGYDPFEGTDPRAVTPADWDRLFRDQQNQAKAA